MERSRMITMVSVGAVTVAMSVSIVAHTGSGATVGAPVGVGPATVTTPAHRLAGAGAAEQTAEQRVVAEVVAAVNVERSARGLWTLRSDARIDAVARAHAAVMVAQGRLSHTGPDGSDAGDRLVAGGYPWDFWGENLAAGSVAPGDVVEAWMNSPSHRANLLGDFLDIGVGAVADADGTPYWVAVLARPAVTGG